MKIEKIDAEIIKNGHPHLNTVTEAYIVDNLYKVYIAQTGKYKHLRIRRIDDLPVSSFSDMQNIKNQFLGPETEAIQVYPKVSNYINNSNTYHLFTWDGIETPNLKDMYSYIKS